jgi:hypothetical protein
VSRGLTGRATLARERMGVGAAAAFDDAVRTVMQETTHASLESGVIGSLTWGKPLPGQAIRRLSLP